MFVAEDAKGPEFLRILSLMDEARSRAARLHKKQQELLQKEACCPLQTDGMLYNCCCVPGGCVVSVVLWAGRSPEQAQRDEGVHQR